MQQLTYTFEQTQYPEVEDDMIVCNEHPEFKIQIAPYCVDTPYVLDEYIHERYTSEDGFEYTVKHHGEFANASDAMAKIEELVSFK